MARPALLATFAMLVQACLLVLLAVGTDSDGKVGAVAVSSRAGRFGWRTVPMRAGGTTRTHLVRRGPVQVPQLLAEHERLWNELGSAIPFDESLEHAAGRSLAVVGPLPFGRDLKESEKLVHQVINEAFMLLQKQGSEASVRSLRGTLSTLAQFEDANGREFLGEGVESLPLTIRLRLALKEARQAFEKKIRIGPPPGLLVSLRESTALRLIWGRSDEGPAMLAEAFNLKRAIILADTLRNSVLVFQRALREVLERGILPPGTAEAQLAERIRALLKQVWASASETKAFRDEWSRMKEEYRMPYRQDWRRNNDASSSRRS